MKSKIILNTIIEAPQWTEALDFDAVKVSEELKELVFDYVADVEKHKLLKLKKTYVVNVCLSDNESVHKLNKEFRGMDKPTNVLSFANADDAEFEVLLKTEDELDLGDIILAFETLCSESEQKGISIYAHYCHLLVHGFLHILGYDHQDDDEAENMEALETEILALFSIDNPYDAAEDA